MKKIKMLLLFTVLAALLAGCGQADTVTVREDRYPKDAQSLDLRDKEISIEYYEELRTLLPGCRIQWNVPFQGERIPSDAQEVTVTALTEADVAQLVEYLPQLKEIHADQCDDYAELMQLKKALPDVKMEYFVALSGKRYHPMETKALTLEDGNASELMANLAYLPEVTSIHFSSPTMAAEDLLALRDAYPKIHITWDKAVMGTVYPCTITELDLSEAQLESTEALEAELAYFPELEMVLLSHCNLDSETLAAYRDRVREDYKVVWSVKLGKTWTRTDAQTFAPVREKDTVDDEDLAELKYCEDLIVVDLGHMLDVTSLDWIYHTPKLQYLMLVETPITDLTPIGTLKELVYLEIFLCKKVTDYTPLIGCTALRDLNVAKTRGDIKVFAQMPWLKCLYANACKAPEEDKQYLRENLPNTILELDSPAHLASGWRDRDLYYSMRDLLGMKYIPTNALHYKERMAGTYGGND